MAGRSASVPTFAACPAARRCAASRAAPRAAPRASAGHGTTPCASAHPSAAHTTAPRRATARAAPRRSSSPGAAGDPGNPCPTAAAVCFTTGRWQVDNLSPCFFSTGVGTTPDGAVSTVQAGPQIMCPLDVSMAPAQPWSTDTFTADCAGHFRLCYTLKAGNAKAPQANDCVVAQSCAEGDYATANQAQTWANLPGWITTGAAKACAQAFYASGGYGEMSVTGTPLGCPATSKTLASVTYCPQTCLQDPSAAGCANCLAGGDGRF